jgi:hypothetical protein
MMIDALHHHRDRNDRANDRALRSPLPIDLHCTDRGGNWENWEDLERPRDLHPVRDVIGLLCLAAVLVLVLLILSPTVDALFWKFL